MPHVTLGCACHMLLWAKQSRAALDVTMLYGDVLEAMTCRLWMYGPHGWLHLNKQWHCRSLEVWFHMRDMKV